MSEPNVQLGTWQAVTLVAGREVNTRLRSKAFIITTVATLVLLIGFALVMKTISGGSDATVGFTKETAAIAQPFKAVAGTIGEDVDTKTVSGERAGRDAVADGSLDALVVGDGSSVRVVVKKDLDGNLRDAFNVLAGQVALNEEIVELGGDPAQVSSAVADAKVEVEELEKPYPYDPQQLVLGIIAGILIYIFDVPYEDVSLEDGLALDN